MDLRTIKQEDKEKKIIKKDKMIQLNRLDKRLFNDKVNSAWEKMRRIGWLDGDNTILDKSWVTDCWKGEPCYIIGAGPPLKDFVDKHGWDYFDDKHTIGINHVIEDYDRFEWFFFLDKRFLDRTTYDINNYKGHIFAQATTGLKAKQNIDTFFCRGDNLSSTVNDGLYSGNFSGLAALNLAIITGANPIYLIGFGNGKKASCNSYHYKSSYTGEVKQQKTFDKFCKVQKYYEKFRSFKDRIIHVSNGDDLPIFKKQRILKNKVDSIKEVESYKNKKIIHLSFSDDINIHGDITRHIYHECIGTHEIINVNECETLPEADLYIGEHFLSTTRKLNSLPDKSKIIDIVHTVNCIPNGSYAKVLAITKAWQKWLVNKSVKSELLESGIDLAGYKPQFNPDLLTFGRVTRWSPGKIHPEWNRIVSELLEDKNLSCLMYVDKANESGRGKLKHERMIYDDSLKIGERNKYHAFKNIGIYVHTNATFKETLSLSIIEAMASGCPIIYLTENTGVLEEVTGDAGIRCTSIDKVKEEIKRLIYDKDKRKEMYKKSINQAKKFDKNIMINQMNRIIKECLKK